MGLLSVSHKWETIVMFRKTKQAASLRPVRVERMKDSSVKIYESFSENECYDAFYTFVHLCAALLLQECNGFKMK